MSDTVKYIIIAITLLSVIALLIDSRGTKKNHQRIGNNLRSMSTSLDTIASRAKRERVINIGSWEVWDPYKPLGPTI